MRWVTGSECERQHLNTDANCQSGYLCFGNVKSFWHASDTVVLCFLYITRKCWLICWWTRRPKRRCSPSLTSIPSLAQVVAPLPLVGSQWQQVDKAISDFPDTVPDHRFQLLLGDPWASNCESYNLSYRSWGCPGVSLQWDMPRVAALEEAIRGHPPQQAPRDWEEQTF